MNETITTVTREELYQQVWAAPAVQLAKKYGISSTALAKICKKLNVPRPGRGHWRRVQLRQKIVPPSLPDAGKCRRVETVIRPVSSRFPVLSLTPEMQSRIEAESRPENHIHVSECLRDPHPLICQTKSVIETAETSSGDVVWPPPSRPRLDLEVSKAFLSRALRIMDALLKALEQRGFTIELAKDQSLETRVLADREKICIRLCEVVDSIELPAEKCWGQKRRGRLCFRIVEYDPKGGRKTWTDGKRYCLEDCLNEIVIGIMASAEAKRQWRLKREEEERQWREEQRRRQEEERIRQEEAAHRKELENQAASWAKCAQIRAFLAACEQAVTERTGSLTPGSPVAQWLAWAYRHADRFDPFKNGYFQPLLEQSPLANAPAKSNG